MHILFNSVEHNNDSILQKHPAFEHIHIYMFKCRNEPDNLNNVSLHVTYIFFFKLFCKLLMCLFHNNYASNDMMINRNCKQNCCYINYHMLLHNRSLKL